MIKAVLFDLDGTLYDRDETVEAVFREQCAAFESDLLGAGPSSFVSRSIELDDHGYGEKGQLYRTLAQELGLGAEVADRLHADFWPRYIDRCEATGDTRTTLEVLRERGLKLGVITNGSAAIQEPKLESLGLKSFFDVILISEVEGLRKPDPAIFRRALERCGVQASEAIFVGDHPEFDVVGARSAGLTPIWKRVSSWPMTEVGVVTVDQLSQILPWCLVAASDGCGP